MDTREIKHVVALSRHLNFTAAADELGITQSALSKSIQAIEERYQARLFDRNRGGVRLTALGRELTRKAASVLTQIRDLDRFAKDATSSDAGKVCFGMTPAPASVLLSPLILKMNSQHPQLSCHVAVRTADAMLQALVNEEVEFYIGGEHLFSRDEAIDRKLLGHFPAGLIVRSGHPALEFKPEDLSEHLADFPILFTGPFPSTLEHPNSQILWRHAVHYVLEGLNSLARLAEESDAILLGSPFSVLDEIEQGRLKLLPYTLPQPVIRVMIHTLANRSLSPAAKRVIQEARREVARLTKAQMNQF